MKIPKLVLWTTRMGFGLVWFWTVCLFVCMGSGIQCLDTSSGLKDLFMANVVDNAWRVPLSLLYRCPSQWSVEFMRESGTVSSVFLSLETFVSFLTKTSHLRRFLLSLPSLDRESGLPKDPLIFHKVATIQTCLSKDKHCPRFCFLVGVCARSHACSDTWWKIKIAINSNNLF